MALVEIFEDMLSWKKARELKKLIYSETLKTPFSKDYALKDQIRKSSISIMSNIAEGFERGNDREFRYFLKVAKGSAGELRSQLYVATDLEYMDGSIFTRCYDHLIEITKLICGFIDKLNLRINNSTIAVSKSRENQTKRS